MDQHDVAIIGGSLNGTGLALALARAGLKVAVIEAQPDSGQIAADFDGRAYALAAASVKMLKALGLWDRLAPVAQPILDIKVSDGRTDRGPGPFRLHFDHRELDDGPMGQMVEDRHLRAALLEAVAAEPGITRIFGRVTAQTLGPAAMTVTLADGRGIAASLLVGADGRRSGTAERAHIRRRTTQYSQTALVAVIGHDAPHHGIAHQQFLPPGPLAILPLTGHRSSIVWSETDAQARALLALPEAEFLDVLRPRFGDFLGEIRLDGPRYAYPLNLTVAERFTSARLALVGDAARGVHPIAGQGLNAGWRDVATLAEVLVEAHRRGEDPGSTLVLDRYAGWRRFDSTALELSTDMFNRLFSNDNGPLRLARGLGLAAAGALPPLRRALMREAAGLTGDLPRLLTGRPL